MEPHEYRVFRWYRRCPLVAGINMAEYGSCCKQRGLHVDKSHRNSRGSITWRSWFIDKYFSLLAARTIFRHIYLCGERTAYRCIQMNLTDEYYTKCPICFVYALKPLKKYKKSHFLLCYTPCLFFRSWHKETQEQTKIPQETKVKRKMVCKTSSISLHATSNGSEVNEKVVGTLHMHLIERKS